MGRSGLVLEQFQQRMEKFRPFKEAREFVQGH